MLDRHTVRLVGRLAPWAVVAALAVVLATRASELVAAIHSNSDLAAPLAMAHLLDQYDGATAMTGNYGWWGGLWIVQLLRALPGDTLPASYLPLAGMVVAIAALTLQGARLFGARSAVVIPLVAGAVGAATWTMDGAWSGRATSWWGMIALGIVLVAGARGVPRRAWATFGLLCAAVAVWCAVALSGDALAWTSMVLPALGVAAVAVATRRPWSAVLPAVMAVSIAALSFAVRALANDRGYLQRPSPTGLAPFESAQSGTGNVIVGLEAVWRDTTDSVLGAAAGYLGMVLVVAAVAGGVTALLAAVVGTWTGAARDDGQAPGTGERPAETERDPGLRETGAERDGRAVQHTAWAAYWTSAVLATTIAFAFSESSFAGGQPVARYLFGIPFAAGALLALLADRSPSRTVVVVPAALLAALGAVGMARTPPPRTMEARTALLPAVQDAARAEGVTRGYASYWSAYPMTVRSGFRLQVDPVGECTAPAGVGLCPMYLHYVDRAYEPRPGIRSFLLVDDGLGTSPGPGVWVTRPPDGVTPVAVRQIGPNLRMLVYDHDIASDLQPRTVMGEPLRHRD